MPRTLTQRPKKPEPPLVEQSAWRWLTQAAFFLVIALVIARSTIQETVGGSVAPVPGGPVEPASPGPATGLVLDLLMCVPAKLVLARRLLDDRFALRLAWSYLPMSLLAAWALGSVLWSGDKFAAIVAASHWAAAMALLWSASQLVHTPPRLRLLGAVGFSLLLVLLVQGFYYRFVDLPDLQRDWRQHGAELLQKRGTAPNSIEATQLARNIESGEVSGFNISRNTYAALLVLLVFLCAGVVIQAASDRDHLGRRVALLVGIALALLMLYRYVQSRTAFVTPIIGGLLLAAMWKWRRLVACRSKRIYWGGVVLFVLGTAAVVGHGLKHASLFHPSLTFRWQYWVGAGRIFVHHPWIGVGWANFGAHYLTHRLPQAVEEPRDPHNFLVRAAVELGVGGGVLMIAWMLRLWWELTSSRSEAAAESPDTPADALPPGSHTAVPLLVLLSVVAISLNAIVSVDWMIPLDAGKYGAWIFLELFKRGLFLIVLLTGMGVAALRSLNQRDLDERPAPWVFRGLLLALGLFLFHNLIDFSMFEPGATFLFALLIGGALGMRLPDRPPTPRGRVMAVAVFILVGVALIVAAGAGVWNVALAESLAHDADDQVRMNQPAAAARELIDASRYVPINADYAYRAAMLSAEKPLLARQLLEKAATTDPTSARCRRALAELAGNTGDMPAALDNYAQALALDPNNIDLRLEYADFLRDHNRPADARQQYERALWYNQQLKIDEIRRLPPARVEQISKTIQSLAAK